MVNRTNIGTIQTDNMLYYLYMYVTVADVVLATYVL